MNLSFVIADARYGSKLFVNPPALSKKKKKKSRNDHCVKFHESDSSTFKNIFFFSDVFNVSMIIDEK